MTLFSGVLCMAVPLPAGVLPGSLSWEEGFLGCLEAVGLGAGLDQGTAECDPVGDGRAEPGVAEG
jgi:hypothetical protein